MPKMFIILVFVISACDDPPPEATRALGARVEIAAGDVWLVTSGEKERLITGAMLPEEASIEVGTGSRAIVRLGTGTGVFFRGGAKVRLRDNLLELLSGEIWVDVPHGEGAMSRFKAGEVSVTARSTGFDFARGKDGVHLYVARGIAVVNAPGGRAEVRTGEQAVVEGKSAPKVSPVYFWEDWTGGIADRELFSGFGGKATGRIFGVDRARPGLPPRNLQILSQNVKITIRDGVARTVVDQRFFNPSSQPLEGWYWFNVPEGASVERFAVEMDGVLVEGEMTERKQAAEAYEEAVEKEFEPALLEWIDSRTFRAKIYPLPAAGARRVRLSYTEMLSFVDGVYRYVYPMGARNGSRIDEFSLDVDLGEEGKELEIAALQEARIEKENSHVYIRRSGYVPRADFLLELKPKAPPEPMRAIRFSAKSDEADFIMLRYSPKMDWNRPVEVKGDVVVVLDTSAGGDDTDRQIRSEAMEAILRALSVNDRFAVVAMDLTPRVVYPSKGLAPADEGNVSSAVEKLAEVGSAGASDLGEIFSTSLSLLHKSHQPALVYIGDGRATVGETTPSMLENRLRRALGESRARLFTIGVGAEADHSLLRRLARVGGGRSFRIDTAEQTVSEALRFVGMLKTPTITNLTIDVGNGLDQMFSTATGKISKGEEVIITARTHHSIPGEIIVRGEFGGETLEKRYATRVEKGDEHAYVAGLWARQYLDRLMGRGLEQNRGRIVSLGLKYSLMTPFTSFLVLESDDAYYMQGIERRRRYSMLETVAAPLLLLGCSSQNEKEYAKRMLVPQQDEVPEWLKKDKKDERQGGKGKRHKGEEGQMGKRDARKTDSHYGIKGPKDNPNPHMARSMAKEMANSSGILQYLSEANATSPFDVDLASEIVVGSFGTEPVIQTIPGKLAARDKKKEKKQSFKARACSDASSRSLPDKRILWQRRMGRVEEPGHYFDVFVEAGEQCELSTWRDRRVMLDLIEQYADNPEKVKALLDSFGSYKRIQAYLRKKILRRTLDPVLSLGLYAAGSIDWRSVRLGLAALKTPEDRVSRLRVLLQNNPEDPIGRGLLTRHLFDAGMDEESMALAFRLRRERLASPTVLEVLCELQAGAGLLVEARRTCSELVEFNPDDPVVRQRLGDMFIRHGWYGEAYKQYENLAAMLKHDPVALLKLAASAAGMGRVDQALRIERKIAAGEGEQGPNDPRRLARLHSAARLTRLLTEARGKNQKDQVRVIERSLKRTQVFAPRTTVALLVWQDFEAKLDVQADIGGKMPPISERVASDETGLVMLDLGGSSKGEISYKVNARETPKNRTVPFRLITVTWDGKTFTIEQRDGQIDQDHPPKLRAVEQPARVKADKPRV